MKKIILICIGLAIAVGIFASWKYISPARTVLKICSIKSDSVSSITLINGNNGHRANIVNKNEITRILNIINSAKYKYLKKTDSNGFKLQIKISSVGKANMFFSSDEFMNLDNEQYVKTSGGINIKKLLDYIN